ncbi:MAG: ATPase, partial [Firmicutes bacterium HGW-Firmicutes-1]
MISRKNYLEKLIANKDHKIIKVVTGVRRCGKSTLFRLYIDYLKSIGIQDHQIIAINLEDIDNEELLDYKKLYNYVKERLCKDQITYIFIDEVQNCKNFEKAVDSLFIKEDT